jgi:nitrate reductase NapD
MEVHAISDQGKIVFTVEGESQKDIANNSDFIKQHQHVLSLSPIYHQFLNE